MKIILKVRIMLKNLQKWFFQTLNFCFAVLSYVFENGVSFLPEKQNLKVLWILNIFNTKTGCPISPLKNWDPTNP
jgi:hypothetical protein